MEKRGVRQPAGNVPIAYCCQFTTLLAMIHHIQEYTSRVASGEDWQNVLPEMVKELSSRGQEDSALELCDIASENATNSLLARHTLATCYSDLKRFDKAAFQAAKMVILEPTEAAYYRLGVMQRLAGNTQAALEALLIADRLSPTCWLTKAALADLAERANNYRLAVEYLRESLALVDEGGDSAIWVALLLCNLARVLFIVREVESARESQLRASEIFSRRSREMTEVSERHCNMNESQDPVLLLELAKEFDKISAFLRSGELLWLRDWHPDDSFFPVSFQSFVSGTSQLDEHSRDLMAVEAASHQNRKSDL